MIIYDNIYNLKNDTKIQVYLFNKIKSNKTKHKNK